MSTCTALNAVICVLHEKELEDIKYVHFIIIFNMFNLSLKYCTMELKRAEPQLKKIRHSYIKKRMWTFYNFRVFYNINKVPAAVALMTQQNNRHRRPDYSLLFLKPSNPSKHIFKVNVST